jgi:hypothetical protein
LTIRPDEILLACTILKQALDEVYKR